MGFNRVTWSPGHERKPVGSARFRQLARLRRQREARARESTAAHALAGSLMSLAALLGGEVKDPDGRSIGRLRDVVVHWTTRGAYPSVKAIVVRSGKRDFLIGARWLDASPPAMVRLRSSRAYVGSVERHPADVALAHDVLDRQLVDAGGVQIVRPADLYLAVVRDRIELVGIEVGVGALLRRIGPRSLCSRLRPDRVIDWRSITAFTPARADGERHRGRSSDLAGHAGAGIALDRSAGEVTRLKPSEIQDALDELEAKHKGASP
jgi:sporulation protein YlmC with PRC-barrel domain